MYVLFAISLMSAPAAKALSEPVITMQPTLGSASKRSAAASNWSLSVAFSAFKAFGRFSWITPTRRRVSVTMASSDMTFLKKNLWTG